MLVGKVSAGQAGSLQGDIVDTQNRSLAGVRISVMPLTESQLRPLSAANTAVSPGAERVAGVSVRTNGRGHYELKSIKLGQYRVMASKVGYEPVFSRLTLKAGQNQVPQFRMKPIAAPLAARIIDAARTKTVVLQGRVLAKNKAPIRGARVELKVREA